MTPEIHEMIVELEINASPAKVWTAMKSNLPEWWPKDFVGVEGGKMMFEPFAGGRLYEDNNSGSSLLWGTVVMIVEGVSIDITGPVTPQFGGPSLNFVRMEISAEGDATKFKLTNTVLGNMGDSTTVDSGWRYLFGGLKSYCEES